MLRQIILYLVLSFVLFTTDVFTTAEAVTITNDRVFAYAEANYPKLFPGTAADQQFQQYTYRYYPASANYLAVDTANVIFMLGPDTGNVLTNVGSVASFADAIIAWEALSAGVTSQNGVTASADVTTQNGVTATGQYNIEGSGSVSGSIAVSWTNTCTVCSWQLSTKYNNDPWVIHAVLPKGVTQYTIEKLRPGQEYQVKMDAKRANRWVNRALFTNMTGKDPNADDGTILKQIIFFGRHSIRSSVFPIRPSELPLPPLEQYAHDTYPNFAPDSHSKILPNVPIVPTGWLTPNGQEAAKLFGTYFRDYLLREGLLTNDATTNLSHSYFRANSIQRSNITAAKFGEGLINVTPYTTIPVHSYSLGNPENPDDPKNPSTPDPVFDPIAKSLRMVPTVDLHLDPDSAVMDAEREYGSAEKLQFDNKTLLNAISKVLYPPGTGPRSDVQPPAQGSIDPTKTLFTLVPNPVVPIPPPPPADLPLRAITKAGGFVQLGGLGYTNAAIDPFLMQYTDNFLPENVAWNRLLPDAEKSLSEQSKLITLQIDIEMRLPYVSKVQSSNAASHVLRTMSQARYGSNGSSGVFGDGNSEIKVIISSDYYVAGLAGLLDLHWTLTGSGYQPDYCCSPNGTIVFELRKYKISKAYVVRAFYYAPTLGQLRGLTPLSLGAPPAREQLKIDGLYEISFDAFNTFLSPKIYQQYVLPFSQVPPPDVLTDVPLEELKGQ